jgi:hypothetical protein
MPIHLKYADMNNRVLRNALSRLANHDGFRGQFAYTISKLIRKWDEEAKIATELLLKLMKTHAKLDEKGEIIPKDGTGFELNDLHTEKDWEDAVKKFDQTEFTIEVNALGIDELEKVGLTPNEMIAMEKFLKEPTPIEAVAS